MYCRQCGKKNDDNTIFCAYCGQMLIEDLPDQKIQKRKGKIKKEKIRKKKKFPWYACASIILVFALLIFIGGMVKNYLEKSHIVEGNLETENEKNLETNIEQYNKALITSEMGTNDLVFYDFIKQVLVPYYGLADMENRETKITKKKDNWLEPNGIVSAEIYDLDMDGDTELFLLYYSEYETDNYQLFAEVYEISERKVLLAATSVLAPTGASGNHSVTCAANQCSEDNIHVSICENTNLNEHKEEIHIFIEFSRDESVVSEGVFESYWTMVYDDGLTTDYSFTQTAEGDEGSEYSGYDYRIPGAKILYSDIDKEAGEYYGKLLALRRFFEDKGFYVTTAFIPDSIVKGPNCIAVYDSRIVAYRESTSELEIACTRTSTDHTGLRKYL